MRILVWPLVVSLVTTSSAQHLWYNDPGIAGDLLAGSVKVDVTAPYTYYEVLGWNQGGLGGGYTGIQDNGGGRLRTTAGGVAPSSSRFGTRARPTR